MHVLKLFTYVSALSLAPFSIAAANDYVVVLTLTNPSGNELMKSHQFLGDFNHIDSVESKSYLIKECTSTKTSKKITTGGKAFYYGHAVTVDTAKNSILLKEFYIDDSKFDSYDLDDCFNNEVKQLKFISEIPVNFDGTKEFKLDSGNTLKVFISN
ncbi:hypothetical protein K2B98_004561 [Vibrio parahaemolyticus]|uniref:hypothetical protein n=1 Tax=Vibrio aestuarianus TaxID=28171 RepID=UPI001A1E2C99|nr:hypothetical protein [Vibrio aestuarianus]EGQ7900657.1 hypothetical protein [Vibrio parahaemolyticus]EHH1182950.1 hypothetical protein [Vibrio vulnificus]EGQ9499040.1 hypothetical protein [Vibrio parahaemolyticus]EGQ9507768.1 hypothetical protein [Vibrio parahaemolyticus]EGQ9813908.1 hypothetical protein [Vibrio parahaemolyticus]